MTPRGAQPLIAMRMQGRRPPGNVFVSFGRFPDPQWAKYSNTVTLPELVIRPDDPIERLDFRCLVDLDVILFAGEWSASVGKIYELLIQQAKEIAVQIVAFGDDIGWFWIRGHGRIEFEDRQHFEAIQQAKAEAVGAARERNDKAHAAALAKEAAARRAMSWPN